MSLSWNAQNAENWGKLHDGAKESVIFHTMFLGINRITEENYQEFYKRYVQLQRANGWDNDELYLKPEDIHNAVGLSTNASTFTPAAWRKRLTDSLEAWGKQQVQNAYEAKEETL